MFPWQQIGVSCFFLAEVATWGGPRPLIGLQIQARTRPLRGRQSSPERPPGWERLTSGAAGAGSIEWGARGWSDQHQGWRRVSWWRLAGESRWSASLPWWCSRPWAPGWPSAIKCQDLHCHCTSWRCGTGTGQTKNPLSCFCKRKIVKTMSKITLGGVGVQGQVKGSG